MIGLNWTELIGLKSWPIEGGHPCDSRFKVFIKGNVKGTERKELSTFNVREKRKILITFESFFQTFHFILFYFGSFYFIYVNSRQNKYKNPSQLIL